MGSINDLFTTAHSTLLAAIRCLATVAATFEEFTAGLSDVRIAA